MSQSPEAAATTGNAPVAFAALRHKDYRRYFFAGMVSMMGDNIEHVISYWVIWEAFHSPTLAGFAVIGHWAPFLFFGVFIGSLSDKYDSRRIIQASQVLYVGLSLAWGVLFLTDTIQIWHAVVLLVFHGFAGALNAPASQLIIHDVVGTEHLQSAVRLNATSRQLGLFMGPSVGGLLMLVVGPSWGLIINAIVFLPLFFWLFTVPYTGHLHRAGARRPQTSIKLTQAFSVMREASKNRTIMAMVVLAGVSSIFVGNAYQAQMPEFAEDLLAGDGGFLYTMLLTANAAGAVSGGFILEGGKLLKASARSAMVLALLWCVSVIAFAVAPSLMAALVALFFIGVFNLAFVSMAQTLVQLEANPDQRGRVIGLFNMSAQGLRVGSGVSVGVMGAYVGIHWSLGVSAAIVLALTLGLLAYVTSRKPAPSLSQT
ncbi:MAG: MFS transporter [Chloroflexi bacterium]|nr:MFS transporter [Chloroflexota bacterium]